MTRISLSSSHIIFQGYTLLSSPNGNYIFVFLTASTTAPTTTRNSGSANKPKVWCFDLVQSLIVLIITTKLFLWERKHFKSPSYTLTLLYVLLPIHLDVHLQYIMMIPQAQKMCPRDQQESPVITLSAPLSLHSVEWSSHFTSRF